MVFRTAKAFRRGMSAIVFAAYAVFSQSASSLVFENDPGQPFFASFVAESKGVQLAGDVYFERGRQRLEFSHPLLGGDVVVIAVAESDTVVLIQPSQQTFIHLPAGHIPQDIRRFDWASLRMVETGTERLEGGQGVWYDVSGIAPHGEAVEGRVLIVDGVLRRVDGKATVNGSVVPGRIDLFNVTAIDAWEESLFAVPPGYRPGFSFSPN